MKRFQFSLDPLLRIKQQAKQQLELRAAFIHRRIIDAETRLHSLHESLDGYRDELSGAIADDTDKLQFMLQRQAIELVIKQIDRVHDEMQLLSQDLKQVLVEIKNTSCRQLQWTYRSPSRLA